MTDTQLTDIDGAHAFTQAAGERESEHLGWCSSASAPSGLLCPIRREGSRAEGLGPSAESVSVALLPGIPKGQGSVRLQDPKGHFMPC